MVCSIRVRSKGQVLNGQDGVGIPAQVHLTVRSYGRSWTLPCRSADVDRGRTFAGRFLPGVPLVRTIVGLAVVAARSHVPIWYILGP